MSGARPDWALDRADGLAANGAGVPTPVGYRDAFAAYIAAHEKPPVDPVVEALTSALKSTFPISLQGSHTLQHDVPMLISELRKLGMELSKQEPTP